LIRINLNYYIDTYQWYKENATGDEKPLARTQHLALATPKNDRVFIFGGHHTP
jgi:hypothetical protein